MRLHFGFGNPSSGRVVVIQGLLTSTVYIPNHRVVNYLGCWMTLGIAVAGRVLWVKRINPDALDLLHKAPTTLSSSWVLPQTLVLRNFLRRNGSSL